MKKRVLVGGLLLMLLICHAENAEKIIAKTLARQIPEGDICVKVARPNIVNIDDASQISTYFHDVIKSALSATGRSSFSDNANDIAQFKDNGYILDYGFPAAPDGILQSTVYEEKKSLLVYTKYIQLKSGTETDFSSSIPKKQLPFLQKTSFGSSASRSGQFDFGISLSASMAEYRGSTYTTNIDNAKHYLNGVKLDVKWSSFKDFVVFQSGCSYSFDGLIATEFGLRFVDLELVSACFKPTTWIGFGIGIGFEISAHSFFLNHSEDTQNMFTLDFVCLLHVPTIEIPISDNFRICVKNEILLTPASLIDFKIRVCAGLGFIM